MQLFLKLFLATICVVPCGEATGCCEVDPSDRRAVYTFQEIHLCNLLPRYKLEETMKSLR